MPDAPRRARMLGPFHPDSSDLGSRQPSGLETSHGWESTRAHAQSTVLPRTGGRQTDAKADAVLSQGLTGRGQQRRGKHLARIVALLLWGRGRSRARRPLCLPQLRSRLPQLRLCLIPPARPSRRRVPRIGAEAGAGGDGGGVVLLVDPPRMQPVSRMLRRSPGLVQRAVLVSVSALGGAAGGVAPGRLGRCTLGRDVLRHPRLRGYARGRACACGADSRRRLACEGVESCTRVRYQRVEQVLDRLDRDRDGGRAVLRRAARLVEHLLPLAPLDKVAGRGLRAVLQPGVPGGALGPVVSLSEPGPDGRLAAAAGGPGVLLERVALRLPQHRCADNIHVTEQALA